MRTSASPTSVRRLLTVGTLLLLATACSGTDNGAKNTANAGASGVTMGAGGSAKGGQTNGARGGQSNAAVGAQTNSAAGSSMVVEAGAGTILAAGGQGDSSGGASGGAAVGGRTNVTAGGTSGSLAVGGRNTQGGGGATGSSGAGGHSNATSGGRASVGGGGASGRANIAGGGASGQTTSPTTGGRVNGTGGGTTITGGASGNPSTGGQNNSPVAGATSTATGACRGTRLTTFVDNNAYLGCGYHRAVATIPQLVRDRMYIAMAEPFYGSSYNGSPGESCGECWELTTAKTTATVIVADLCPIEGNVPCSDPNQLHFDLVTNAATTVGGGTMDMAVARPVACPVSGNINLEVTDRSWAYFQAAFFDYRVPLRLVEFQPVGGSTWTAMTRRWGAVWDNMDNQNGAFATVEAGAGSNGAGVTLRLTSAQGQVLTSTVVLNSTNSGVGKAVELGIQFDNLLSVSGDTCKL